MTVKNKFKMSYKWQDTKIEQLNCDLIDMNHVYTMASGVDLFNKKEKEFYILKVYLKDEK